MNEDIKEKLIDILPIIMIIAFIGLNIYIIASTGTIETNDKNMEYEKILIHEFDRTFENYNEYLLYKIEKER